MRARVVFGTLAALIGFYGAAAAVALAIGLALPKEWVDGRWSALMSSLPVVVAALAVNAVLVWRGWATWRMLGWTGDRRDVGAWWRGAAVGALIAAVALAVAIVVGGARIEVTGERFSAYLAVALPLAVGLVVAALAEELLFRGYPLARLAEPVGKVWASLVLAVVFAAAHGANPDVAPLGLVNVGLASLVLSAAFFTPGGLPLAWGVHFGWNGGLALGADAPVSGLTFDIPVLGFLPGRSTWVTGGAFGPEGGVAASVAMAGALIWLSRRAARAGEGERT